MVQAEKYKVGDRVIVGEEYQLGCLQVGKVRSSYFGTVAEIVSVPGGTLVWPYRAKFFDGTESSIGDHEIERLATEEPKCEPALKFKVGDEVVIKEGFDSMITIGPAVPCAGNRHRISGIDSSGSDCYPYRIPVGDYSNWFTEESLEPYVAKAEEKPEFKVGDRVVMTGKGSFVDGSYIECPEGEFAEVVDADDYSSHPVRVIVPGRFTRWVSADAVRTIRESDRSCQSDACCRSSCPNTSDCKAEAKPQTESHDGELAVFSTGAVRSKDADDVRYDLITPIGILEVAKYGEYADIRYGSIDSPNILVNECLAETYRFLSGSKEEPHLVFAALAVLHAARAIEGGND